MPTGYDISNQDFWDNAPRTTTQTLKAWEGGMENRQYEQDTTTDENKGIIPKDRVLNTEATFTPVDHDPSKFTPVSHDPQQFTPVPWDPFTQTLGKFGKAMAEGTGKLVKDFIDSGSNQTLTENDPTGRGKTVDLGAELAFNLMGFGTAFIPEKAVGMFGGKLSAVMQSPEGQAKLKEALGKLKGEGMTKEQLWEQYGLFTGADGKLRFEIPDTNAQLNLSGFNKKDDTLSIKNYADNLDPIKNTAEEWVQAYNKHDLKLSDILDHPELYKHYPDLADIKIKPVSASDMKKEVEGSYYLNSIELAPAKPDKMRSTLLHEIQHAIQEREGFARGGNPQEFESKTFKTLDAEKATREKFADNLLKDLVGTSKEKMYKAFDDWSMNQEKFSPESLSTLSKVAKKTPELYDEVRRLYLADNVAKRYRAATTAEYRKLAGEVESNNVEFRDFISRPMPDEWWTHDTFMPPPWRTEGTNRLNQIILQQGERYVRPRK